MADDKPTEMSDVLRRQILSSTGPDQEWTRLGGQSGRRVFSVVGSRGSCALKLDPHEIEHRFYTRFAVQVSESGLGVPRLLGHSQDPAYLLIERVDTDLEPSIEPQTLVAELHQFHMAVATPHNEELFKPQWPADLTSKALQRLNMSDPAVRRRADDCRIVALDAGAPERVISGDPNPSNWGRRGRDLVLFDWERFGVGQPELDVAIVMRGLPGRREIEAVASHYSALSGRGSPESLYQKAVAWKLWTVLEFVTEPPSPARERTMEWLGLNFGQWVGSV